MVQVVLHCPPALTVIARTSSRFSTGTPMTAVKPTRRRVRKTCLGRDFLRGVYRKCSTHWRTRPFFNRTIHLRGTSCRDSSTTWWGRGGSKASCTAPHSLHTQCSHLSGHVQLNGVAQYDHESVRSSCDIGYRVAVTVVVQEVTCMWTDHEGDARTRPQPAEGVSLLVVP